MSELLGKEWRQKVRSPSIESLRSELVERPNAVNGFWASVAASGAPLIEEIPGEDDARCVTFIYRDYNGTLDHVALCQNIIFNDFSDNHLVRVGQSDLLALSLRLPADTRTAYLLSPDEPLSSFFDPRVAADERYANWQPDPLNPKEFVLPFNEWQPTPRHERFSVLELPGAAPKVWSLPPADGETVPAPHPVIHESEGGDVRRLWYHRIGAATPERLLVALDGWSSIHIYRTPLVLSRLHHAGLIPPLAVVFVDCGTTTMRNRDYLGSHDHSEYLTHEIVPTAARFFDMTPTRERTVIYGVSAGGLTALATGFRNPGVFGHILALMTPAMVTNDDLPEGIVGEAQKVAEDLRPRVHLQVGRLEVDTFWGGQFVAANRDLRKNLTSMDFDVELDEESCGHDPVHYSESVVKGLIRLLTIRP